jgi:alpha-L-fucosidase
LTHDWGWTRRPVFKSAGKVISILSEIVAKGGSLLLGVGPTPEGLIEDKAVEKLEEIGSWLRLNGEAIYATVTTPIYQNEDKTVFFTANKDGKTLYAIVPRDDKNGIPATIEWTGNAPKKGSKLINLATKKSLKWKTVGDKTTVILPSNAVTTNGVAIKFVVK